MIENKLKEINCKTDRGRKTDGLGFLGEITVKEKLWRYGYSVKHLAKSQPYDLEVEGKFRVEVRSSMEKIVKGKGGYWSPMIYSNKSHYDILAIVLFYQNKFNTPTILFFRKQTIKSLNSHFAMVFSGSGQGAENFLLGEKKPYKVFGKPQKVVVDKSS